MPIKAVSEKRLQQMQQPILVGLAWCAIFLSSMGAWPHEAQARTAIVTGTEWVFIRRGPGNQFPPFARIPSGSTVEVQEVRDDWAQIITASGQVGFIHVRFLSFPDETSRQIVPPSRATPHHLTPSSPAMATPEASPRHTAAARAEFPQASTKTPTLTPTLKATRTPVPTRTRTPTRSSTPTRSPSPTRSLSPTRTPTGTPSAITIPSVGSTTSSRVAASPAVGLAEHEGTAQRLHELEAELLATRQELAMCRQQSPHPSLASCPQELREELARLRSLIERERRSIDSITSLTEPDGAVGKAENSPVDNHVVTPLAVFLGTFGLLIGWFSGVRYGRRRERMRRWQLRVK